MRILNKISALVLSFITILSFSIVSVKITAVSGYDSTILNQGIPSGYYDKVDLSLTGNAFKNSLYDIISVGHVRTPYGSQTNSILQKSDPDPNKSGYIICLYTGQSLSSGWNKEHVWAKSHGFPESSTEPYCDLHHLRPTLSSINSSRSNSDFGGLDGVSCNSDSYGNKWTSSIFEPRDEVKGDVARMMFYMETRYGSKTSFNLTLVNNKTTSTSGSDGKFGHLDTLLKWHYEDPVSDSEIYRNNVVYGYQKNRNPYIDHPEYVDLAYPNGFGDPTINQDEVNNVIAKINQLPNNITLETEDLINECYSLYNVLNLDEKELVTNYNVLTQAKAKLDELKKEESKPDIPEGDMINIDFTTTTGITGSYQPSQTGTVSGNKYYFSYAYKSGTDVRLGHNKNTTVPAKFNISGDGSALEFSYDIENIKYINFGKNGSYGTINKWYIMLSTDGGNSYTELGSGTDIENITVNLDTPVTGRIALVIVGTKPRLVLGTATIGTGEEEKINLDSINIGTYLSVDYTYAKGVYTVTNCSLNFKPDLTGFKFDSNNDYYMVLIKTGKLDSKISDIFNHDTIEEMVTEFDGVIKVINSNDNIIKINSDIDDEYTAVMVMNVDGQYYFSNEVTYSIKSVINYYFDNNILTDKVMIDVLSTLN